MMITRMGDGVYEVLQDGVSPVGAYDLDACSPTGSERSNPSPSPFNHYPYTQLGTYVLQHLSLRNFPYQRGHFTATYLARTIKAYTFSSPLLHGSNVYSRWQINCVLSSLLIRHCTHPEVSDPFHEDTFFAFSSSPFARCLPMSTFQSHSSPLLSFWEMFS